MRKLLHSLYWLMLILVSVTLCLFVWIPNTESGSRWLVEKAITYSGQPVTITRFQGTLGKRFTMAQLSFQTEAIKLSLEQPALAWRPSGLLRNKLDIELLSTSQINIEVLQQSEQQEQTALVLPEFSLPIDINLDALSIASIKLIQDNKPLEIKNIQASAMMEKSKLRLNSLHLEQADISVDAKALVEFVKPFPLQVQADIRQASLKASTSLELSGHIDDYGLTGNLSLAADALPVVNGDYDAQGSLEAITINKLHLNTLDGMLQLTGKIDWSEQLKAGFSVQGKQLNPAVYHDSYPGNLAIEGTFNWSGNRFDTVFDINGQLRDYPLELYIQADGTPEQVKLEKSKLSSGPNLLTVSGNLSKKAVTNLDWQINAKQLSSLHDDLKGRLVADGQLNGDWESLSLRARLDASELRFQEFGIQSLQGEVMPLDASTLTYEASLNASDIQLQQQQIKNLTLQAKGNPEQHQASLQLEHALAKLSTRLNGAYQQKDKIWQADIQETSISSEFWPELSQVEQSSLSYRAGEINLSPFCLQGPVESFCAEASHKAEETTASADIKNLPMKRFKGWLEEAGELEESLNAQTTLLRKNNNINSRSMIRLDENNQINTDLQLNSETGKLSGVLQASFDKLKWLTLLSDNLMQPQGQLKTDLVLLGSLKQPEVNGTIRLSKGNFKLPDLGTEISEFTVNISSAESGQAILSGSAKSGEGILEIKGNATWLPVENWAANVAITGRNFQAANLPEARLTATPDLKLAMTKSQINLKGDITISTATILLTELPERAVTISEDARIVNADQPEEPAAPTLPIQADINLLLGDAVTLEGKGLKVKLGGKLNIREQPGRPLSARGNIDIISGSYTAYGQDLELQSGRIIFNGPVSKPGVDLKAVRKIGDITVGLRISGTLDKPESEIFSTPAMPESDAIAYLLTGKPLRASGSSDGALIASALTKLGVKGSAGLIEQVRNTTGLSTLEFETGNESSQTALLIGKYLTPQLYVQYVKRLFLESDALQMRYELSPRLHLEAESGTSQGIDLIYQFER